MRWDDLQSVIPWGFQTIGPRPEVVNLEGHSGLRICQRYQSGTLVPSSHLFGSIGSILNLPSGSSFSQFSVDIGLFVSHLAGTKLQGRN
jgi:hypothetical protein